MVTVWQATEFWQRAIAIISITLLTTVVFFTFWSNGGKYIFRKTLNQGFVKGFIPLLLILFSIIVSLGYVLNGAITLSLAGVSFIGALFFVLAIHSTLVFSDQLEQMSLSQEHTRAARQAAAHRANVGSSYAPPAALHRKAAFMRSGIAAAERQRSAEEPAAQQRPHDAAHRSFATARARNSPRRPPRR